MISRGGDRERTSRATPPERRFALSYRIDRDSGCWVWIGWRVAGRQGPSYGSMRFHGCETRAHRVSWMLNRGPIPAGLWVLHRCDNPPCVNPDHLFLGTNSDNQRDSVAKGRAAFLGRRPPNAKLTEEQVKLIRRSSESEREMAALCGVSSAVVHSVRAGATWQWVSD